MQTIKDAALHPNDKVLVRCDLDVPINSQTGKIEEAYRLESSLETLNYVISQKALPIIIGHLGRPDGKQVEELSTKHLKPFFDQNLGPANYILLENLRFDSREEKDYKQDPSALELAKELISATQTTTYVNESFAVSHRNHASFTALPKLLPHYAGLHLAQEVETLGKLLHNPKKPFLVIIGGAKLETKKPVINKFLQISDIVLLGGKMGLQWQEEIPQNLKLPLDYAPEEKDLGDKTLQLYTQLIQTAQTILWAGPVGVFEDPKYSKGTQLIAQEIAKATQKNSVLSIIGGGDTLSAVEKFSDLNSFSFVSVGGGAMLEFIVKGTLPGIEALNEPQPIL
jgi:phosphoglycerate kinase